MDSSNESKKIKLPISTKLKRKVLLVGRNKKGKCVYTDFLTVGAYYGKTHPWDNEATVIEYKLHTVHGMLFDDAGAVEHEFETTFNSKSGEYVKAWTRDSKGKVRKL